MDELILLLVSVIRYTTLHGHNRCTTQSKIVLFARKDNGFQPLGFLKMSFILKF